MGGLSMGGMEPHVITLNRPEIFSRYALLSCGSRENPSRINLAADSLKQAGYNVVSFVSENTAHEFLTWRRSLYQLAPLLFKNN
jgi:hypothetical protein